MKVRLSYTVEAEDVLLEAAKLLGNDATTVQGIIDTFNELISILNNKEKDFSVNHYSATVEELRILLAKLDLKVMEMSQIVEGYEDYCTLQRREEKIPTPDDPDVVFSDVSEEENE